jgi:hypothetical protein
MKNQSDLKYIRQWRIFESMVIKETHYFTEIIQKLMPDDMYAELQKAIIKQPEIGDPITGSRGLRKVRWKIPGSGKRGGLRVIYYWITKENEIFMLFAYKKARSENLTKDQIKLLRKAVEEELSDG